MGGVRGGLYFMHAFNPSSSDGKILSKKMDTVHLADASRNILVIQVWGGLEVSVIPCRLSCSLITHTQAQGLQGVVVPGAVVGVSNLTYRGSNNHHPVAYAGDLSLFTLHPQEHLKGPWEELIKALPVTSLGGSVVCRQDN